MSSLAKMLSILDLFTVERPIWSAEEICVHLGCSAPTGFRYVRELVTAGLLLRLGTGNYSLGPRIITLDYQLRTVDPYFRAGQPLMRQLADQTGCDCVMTRIFEESVVDTHRESGVDGLHLSYGRGRPRPLFHGAAPKVILSTMSKTRLQRLFTRHAGAIAEAKMGADWEGFWKIMQATRHAGHYMSRGELEADVGAIAVPIFGKGTQASGALAVVIPMRRFDLMNHEKLLQLLGETAAQVGTKARQSEGGEARADTIEA